MLTKRRGAIDRPVMPIWRERGSQPRSVTLRVAPSCAPSRVRNGSPSPYASGGTPMPTPMTVCASASRSRPSSPEPLRTRGRRRGGLWGGGGRGVGGGVGARGAQRAGVGCFAGDDEQVAGEGGRRAEELASVVKSIRLREHHRAGRAEARRRKRGGRAGGVGR